MSTVLQPQFCCLQVLWICSPLNRYKLYFLPIYCLKQLFSFEAKANPAWIAITLLQWLFADKHCQTTRTQRYPARSGCCRAYSVWTARQEESILGQRHVACVICWIKYTYSQHWTTCYASSCLLVWCSSCDRSCMFSLRFISLSACTSIITWITSLWQQGISIIRGSLERLSPEVDPQRLVPKCGHTTKSEGAAAGSETYIDYTRLWFETQMDGSEGFIESFGSRI